MHRKWSVGYRCEEVFVGQSGMLRQFSKVHDNLLELSSDIHHCSEIENIMNDMIDTIDIFYLNSNKLQQMKDHEMIKKLHHEYHQNLQQLEEEKQNLNNKMKRIHEDAVVTREMFISDIAQVLSESRNMKSLRIKTKELQRKLHLAESYESDLKEARRQLKEYQKGNLDQLAITTTPSSSSIAIPATKKKTKKFLIHLGDQMLLEIFSFLETQDVLRAAQVCRFVFKRVDTLFGIESQIAKAEWAVEPPDFELDPPSPVVVSPAPVPQMTGTPNPPPAPLGLTKSVADALLKKLSPSELKTIIAINDQQKNSLQKIEQLTSENEDLKSRLQNTESVRDFLISKLKEAEVALKSCMTDNSVIKRQSENDHEVIFFLDNKTQELESSNQELKKRCEQLQVSLELLNNANTHKENQLTVELNLLKEKYETNETKLRSHKKILANEVKTLRQQLEVCQKERDAYLGQLQKLKEVLGGGNLFGSMNPQNPSASQRVIQRNTHNR